MVLDTSAIVATITNEQDSQRFRVAMLDAAFEAYRRFGKGQGHPAQLNIVDCAVYALAKARSLPLLFKGGDFDRTDIHSAVG
jgi:uncharacterized protein with PIN domain